VELVGTVSHPDDPRLAARARARVAGAVLVHEEDAPALLPERPRGPRPEGSRAHDDDVPGPRGQAQEPGRGAGTLGAWGALLISHRSASQTNVRSSSQPTTGNTEPGMRSTGEMR